MKKSVGALLLGASVCLGSLVGCEPGGVGDPCLPEDEFSQKFGGYSAGEVALETRSFQCETRICLVDHFQGRVSCPYGQSQADLSKPGTDPSRCRVPDTNGQLDQDQIAVPVPAWRTDRPARDAVFCSCRCDGPDPTADYCDCPDGFVCQQLTDDYGLDNQRRLLGSYCARQRDFRPNDAASSCDKDPGAENCPAPKGVNP